MSILELENLVRDCVPSVAAVTISFLLASLLLAATDRMARLSQKVNRVFTEVEHSYSRINITVSVQD